MNPEVFQTFLGVTAVSKIFRNRAFNQIQITRLRQECRNSKFVIFQEKLLKVLNCYNFLWVQRHNCSPAASFSNCFMTLYLLKVHLQTFLSIQKTQKCQTLSCGTIVANERNICLTVNIMLFWLKVTIVLRLISSNQLLKVAIGLSCCSFYVREVKVEQERFVYKHGSIMVFYAAD